MIGTCIHLPEYEDACAVLFGPDFPAAGGHMAVPDPSLIKSVFRQRALETHPDRSVLTGEPVSVLEDRFKKVSHAYETLLRFARQNRRLGLHRRDSVKTGSGAVKAGKGAGPGERAGKEHGHQRFYAGSMPEKTLLLGQFLYFSGVITRHTHASAVFWQKTSRPMVGTLAREWKILSRHDICEILRGRDKGERFCEAGARLGYLTAFQAAALLGRQQALQPRIGEYFTARGILDPSGLRAAVRAQHLHNMRHRR